MMDGLNQNFFNKTWKREDGIITFKIMDRSQIQLVDHKPSEKKTYKIPISKVINPYTIKPMYRNHSPWGKKALFVLNEKGNKIIEINLDDKLIFKFVQKEHKNEEPEPDTMDSQE